MNKSKPLISLRNKGLLFIEQGVINMGPLIRFVGASKVYTSGEDTVNALHNISLDINRGDIYGIIGMSGVGKSTLVRCMNSLEKLTSGNVYFNGEDLSTMSASELRKTRQSMSMIFQQFNLFMQRTALENVCFPLEILREQENVEKETWNHLIDKFIHNTDKKEIRIKARELLKLVGLGDKLNTYPNQLSGGQKQRVAIARALATNPQVLLCDEATSALDQSTTQSILDLLKEINQKLGITIVIITHEMKVVEQICSHVAIIDKGEIAEMGTVEEVFTRPKSKIGQQFIYPNGMPKASGITKRNYRIVFDGLSAYTPFISKMVLVCQAPVNIIHANMKQVGDKTMGHMVIQLPQDEKLASKVLSYLNESGLQIEEVMDDVGCCND